MLMRTVAWSSEMANGSQGDRSDRLIRPPLKRSMMLGRRFGRYDRRGRCVAPLRRG